MYSVSKVEVGKLCETKVVCFESISRGSRRSKTTTEGSLAVATAALGGPMGAVLMMTPTLDAAGAGRDLSSSSARAA